MKRTPIYNLHKQLKGRLIDFGGWELPVSYTSIIEEHNAVRNSAGIFDVSHMGEIEITGKDATNFVNYLITNSISNMNNNQVIYSPMCYESGGCVDDLLVYKKNMEDYLLVVNASNVDKDYEWMIEQSKTYNVNIVNQSPQYAQIALQGPKAQEILQQIADIDLDSISFFTFKENVKLNNIPAIVSRTGYTGEDGFEIYLNSNKGEELFKKLLEVGKTQGLLPCGLGARDTLRFESALALYGHELSKDITPVEAGLKYFIKLEKHEFIGKKVISEQIENKPQKVLVGFEMIDKGIPRHGYEVFNQEGEVIGYVTSGSFAPTLKKYLGIALIKRQYRKKETLIYIGVRNKKLQAKVIKKPFYIKKYKK